MYLIEGDLTKNNKSYKFNRVDKYTIYSSMINCYLRDSINIFHTNSISGTIDFLENIAKKISKGINFLNEKLNQENNILTGLKKVKGDNLTPSIVYKNQLASIPCISYKTADVIISHYPKLIDLLNNLSHLEEKERLNI